MQPNVSINDIKTLCGFLAVLLNEDRAEKLTALDDVDVVALFALANRFWLGVALANVLKRHRDYASLNEEARAYCEDVADTGAVRAESHRNELRNLQCFFKERQIQPLFIKGAADLLTGLDNPPGSRWMMDIDVVLPQQHVKPCWKEMIKAGYTSFNNSQPHFWASIAWHHAPALFSQKNVTVELHRYTTSAKNPFLKHPAKVDLCNVSTAEGVVSVLTPTNRLLLAISHDFISHGNYQERRLDVRYLFNTALLVAHYHNEIDWSLLKRSMSSYVEELEFFSYVMKFLFDINTPIDCDAEVQHRTLEACLEVLNGDKSILTKQLGRWRFWSHFKDYFASQKINPKGLRLSRLQIAKQVCLLLVFGPLRGVRSCLYYQNNKSHLSKTVMRHDPNSIGLKK